jgi:hypothetical protein
MNKNLRATLITVGVLLYVSIPAFVWGSLGLLTAFFIPGAALVVGMLWCITRDMLD